MNGPEIQTRQRDAQALLILGAFFIVLGLLVLVGTFWTLDNLRAMLVNLMSGGILTVIGILMSFVSRRMSFKRP